MMAAAVKGGNVVGGVVNAGGGGTGGLPVGLNPNASALLAQQSNQNQMNNMQRQQQEQVMGGKRINKSNECKISIENCLSYSM